MSEPGAIAAVVVSGEGATTIVENQDRQTHRCFGIMMSANPLHCFIAAIITPAATVDDEAGFPSSVSAVSILWKAEPLGCMVVIVADSIVPLILLLPTDT